MRGEEWREDRYCPDSDLDVTCLSAGIGEADGSTLQQLDTSTGFWWEGLHGGRGRGHVLLYQSVQEVTIILKL